MTRRRAGTIISGLAAIGFLGTAALHSTGYASVLKAAGQVPEAVRPLIPMLWLAFAFDLVILGLVVGVVAARPVGPARLILGIAAVAPLAAAALQVRFVGFIPPTAILIALAVTTLVGAAVLPSGKGDSQRGSRGGPTW